MKQQHNQLRRAAALLLAAAALPLTPLAAQDVVPPASTPTPPPVAATPPPEAAPAPAAPTITMGPSAAVRGEPVVHTAPAAAPAAAAPARSARAPSPAVRAAPARAAASTRAATPVSRVAPTPPAVTAAAQPSLASPPAATPVPTASSVGAASGPAAPSGSAMSWWPFLAGAALLAILAAGMIAMRRRRVAEEQVYYEEPVYAAEPVAAEPAGYVEPLVVPARAVHEPEVLAAAAASSGAQSIAQPDRADLEALAATSGTHGDRPWLEFLMRPVRAGAGEDETRVEFELTVGNTGDAPAKDVRVATWLVAGAAASEMERGLIEAPAGAARSELSIPAHDGALVEGSLALPREDGDRSVLPVVVAEARYRLPDGSEGRTAASFAVGLADGDSLEPLSVDAYGLRDDIEARLHGEPERV